MFSLEFSGDFKKSFKNLVKKYRSLEDDLQPLLARLEKGDFSFDDAVPGFEGTIYKARLSSRDQKRGKRGGFRVIYYAITDEEIVTLLAIYAKAQQENISPQEIKRLLKDFRG